jgi:glucose-6-phosphate isomerase
VNPPHHSSAASASSRKLVQIDTARLYRDNIGAEGITTAELDGLAPELRRIHQTVMAQSRGGLDAEFACLDLHATMPDSLAPIEAMAAQIRQFEDVIVIGIGGSSLGAKAVHHAMTAVCPDSSAPRLHFLENIDLYRLRTILQTRKAEKVGVICISKSGGTIETAIQYLILREWLEKELGKDKARAHQWLVTDPASGWLRELAGREGLPSLPVPPKVGGRFSVLTAVGLLPLAVAGMDIRALLDGATDNAARCATDNVHTNPALEIAALFYLFDINKNKRVSIMMPYADPLELIVDWYRQLWAESLGKRMETRPGRPPAGTLPVRAMGAVDQHSQLQMYLESRLDKIFTFLALDSWGQDFSIPLPEENRKYFPYLAGKKMGQVLEAEFQATRQVITETGHPNMTLRLPAISEHVIGQLIDLYQRITVYTGLLYGINPLDQPAVEKAKKLAIQILSGDHSA